MITIHNEILIHRPVHEVFAYVADFENMPKWNYYVRSVTRTTPDVSGSGARFHQIRKSDEQDYELTEYEPPRVVAMVTLPPERKLTMRFTLVPATDGTLLMDDWTIDAGWLSAFAPIVRERTRAAVARNLESLRELLETGATRLPDGRTSLR